VYSVFTKLADGEFLYVASRDDFEQAVRIAEDLNVEWPREYVVRDPMGNDVDLKDYVPIRCDASAESNVS
jgi:hypothetical protein